MAYKLGGPTSVHGHPLKKVIDAIRDSIRQNNQEEALYWVSELVRSGYGQTCWRTLIVIASEDVGLAAPEVFPQIWSLYEAWKEFHNRRVEQKNLFLIQAVMLLSQAQKSQTICEMYRTYFKFERPREAAEAAAESIEG